MKIIPEPHPTDAAYDHNRPKSSLPLSMLVGDTVADDRRKFRHVIIGNNDLAKLGLRTQRRLERSYYSYYFAPHWRDLRAPWINGYRKDRARIRRGRVLVYLVGLSRRRRYGRVAKLARLLAVSRWTVSRSLRTLRAARLVPRRGRRRRAT